MKLLVTILVSLSLLTGCSWTPEKKAAVASSLWADAKAILTQAALNTLANVVQEAANGGQIDFAHAAASSLFATVSASNIRKVVLDATGGNLPKLADAAANVITAQIRNGTGEQVAIQAVASAISASALVK